jgi:hypothetical protein
MTLGGNMPFLRASAWEGGMGDLNGELPVTDVLFF